MRLTIIGMMLSGALVVAQIPDGSVQGPPAPDAPLTDAQKIVQLQRELIRVQSALVEAHACFNSTECLQAKFQLLTAARSIVDPPPANSSPTAPKPPPGPQDER